MLLLRSPVQDKVKESRQYARHYISGKKVRLRLGRACQRAWQPSWP